MIPAQGPSRRKERIMQRNVKIVIFLSLINFAGALWPVTALVNRIEPFVLGLPFFLFWTTLWILVCFFNLLLCYLLWDKREDRRP
jgi:hypothetical protein